MNATKRSKRTRRKYTGEFKAKVALEAIKAQETINQIAARHEVHPHFSIRQQCGLWGLHRSGLYYEPVPESAENLLLMKLLDRQYTRHPEQGVRRMTLHLRERGYEVNPKRVRDGCAR